MNCAQCGVFACFSGELEKIPEGCPMKNQGWFEENFKNYLDQGETEKLALNSARVESEGYGVWTRLEEIMEFAHRMNYRKLGLVFCVGLKNEAARTAQFLKRQDFQVASIVCKAGSIPKEELGLTDNEKVAPGAREPICNPVAQAELLNQEGTDLNLILGLCVGHDTMFIKYSASPVTYVAVKDRVLAHNPLAAVYCQYLARRFK